MKSEVSMADVARIAGCSRSTVSLALRDHPSIPRATRNRVLDVVEQLGYRTNPLVAALMAQRRNRRYAANPTIAVLSRHELASRIRKHAFYRAQLDGVAASAAALGFNVEYLDLKARGMTPVRAKRILQARNIRGAIVAPLPQGETTLEFDFSGLAAVALGFSCHSPLMERVANDHFLSSTRAVAECAALGYKRIGFVNTRDAVRRFDGRWLAGYQFALQQHRMPAQPEPLLPQSNEHVIGSLPSWLSRERPDVVILAHTEKAFQRLIPSGIGRVLLAVDSADGANTGIYQNYPELGRLAVEQLVRKLYINAFSSTPYSHDHLIEGLWVPGSTATGPGTRRR